MSVALLLEAATAEDVKWVGAYVIAAIAVSTLVIVAALAEIKKLLEKRQ